MRIRDLKKWDKIKCDLVFFWEIKKDQIVTYSNMDWMYAKLYTSDGTIVNTRQDVEKEWKFYVFVD